MPSHTLLSPVEPATKSLEFDQVKKKSLVAGSHQAHSDPQRLKLWNRKESPTENKVG